MKLINEFLNRLKYERNYAINTVDSYKNDLEEFRQYVQKDLSHINDTDIMDYLMILKQDKKLGITTIARKISCFRTFYKDLIRMQIIQEDPMNTIELPKFYRPLPNTVSKQEINQIFENFTSEMIFPVLRDRMIFELLYSCGLRVSELCDLTLENIYFEEEMIRVLGKGDKERLIPMGSQLKELLQTYLPIRKDYLNEIKCDYIITSKFRKKVSRMFVWKLVKKYSEDNNITKLHPHMIRHAFATHMLENGADLRLLQDLLGHADLSTTEIYTHVMKEDLRKTLIHHHPLTK